MHAERRVKVGSLDVCNSYSHGSTVIFERLIIICKRRTSSGELHGCFQMRSCIDAEILIGFLYWEFGELLVMPHCWCSSNIGQDNPCLQLRH
ncbi:hypothetical protein Goshw_027234 [Gossypium schwendimanii]|uniref:Uncharacterized protein n=2 Tax=Gossypium schwendimanii TaxID=34291 RepID=A0A7J9N460_GOSSC|nr:hypothetical protein [Gossypium schwendimanii]